MHACIHSLFPPDFSGQLPEYKFRFLVIQDNSRPDLSENIGRLIFSFVFNEAASSCGVESIYYWRLEGINSPP